MNDLERDLQDALNDFYAGFDGCKAKLHRKANGELVVRLTRTVERRYDEGVTRSKEFERVTRALEDALGHWEVR